jgi:hypothetical protein
MKSPFSQLPLLPSSVKREPAIEVWMRERLGPLGAIARRWFEVVRGCGDDVRELLHDKQRCALIGGINDAAKSAQRWHAQQYRQ